MAESLEVRVPLLDDALVRFADAVDEDVLVGARRGKLILRRVLARLLPGERAWARKRGFEVPVERWLRTPRVGARMRELLVERRLVLERLAGVDAPARFGAFLNGRFGADEVLWLASVASWAQRFGVEHAVRSDVEQLEIV
jgi:asparagine synthase (glutamine-hydrolysing)